MITSGRMIPPPADLREDTGARSDSWFSKLITMRLRFMFVCGHVFRKPWCITSRSVRGLCVGNSREHLWTNLVFIVKSKNHVRPTRAEKDFMRTGFAFDFPSNAEKGSENAF